jgi:hypothetical protein
MSHAKVRAPAPAPVPAPIAKQIARWLRDVVFHRFRGRWVASPRKVEGAYGYGRTRAQARTRLRESVTRGPFVDLDGPRNADLRKQLANPGRLYSARESQAMLRWLEKGGAQPWLPDTLRRRARLGLGPHDRLEYHFTKRRPLTPDETHHAEDRQVLEAVASACAATLRALAGRFRDSVSTGDLILDWGGDGAARCARLRPVLARLRAGGLARVVGRRWVITREGYRWSQHTRWDQHRHDVALTLAGPGPSHTTRRVRQAPKRVARELARRT